MPNSLLQRATPAPRARRYGSDDSDVFCLIKEYVADSELSQDPLLCYPGAKKNDALEALKKIANAEVFCNLFFPSVATSR